MVDNAGHEHPVLNEGVPGPSRGQVEHSEPIEIKAEDVKQEPRSLHLPRQVVVTTVSNSGLLYS